MGYAGSRDYVGTLCASHISVYPTGNRLRPSRKISLRVTYNFKLFATQTEFCQEGLSLFFSGT